MKKQILNLGKALNKAEQKSINGGAHTYCEEHNECPGGQGCCFAANLCFRDDYYGLEQPGGFCWNV